MKWWWLAVVAVVIVFNPYWKIENNKLVRINGASKADEVAGDSSTAASAKGGGLPKMVTVVGPRFKWVDEPEDTQEPVERPAYKPHPSDRIIPTPAGGANHFLHKTLVVPKYVIYELKIPPGSTGALLSGTFEAFINSGDKDRQAANIQVLLLDEPEARDFVHGKPGSMTHSTEGSTKQEVRWILNPDYKLGKKYYLVFSNLGSGPGTKLVAADFSVDAQ